MKLYISNKLISLGGSSIVYDENKNKVFKVKGKLFTLTSKKKIYDMNKNLVYVVRNKYFNFINSRAYIIRPDRVKEAVVKRKNLTLKSEYIIEGFQDEIAITGNFIGWDLTITKNGEVVGTIKRNVTAETFWLGKDSFCLEAQNEEDVKFLVAVVIAIDNILDKK